MRSGKREARRRVIERRAGPVSRRVALLARRWEPRLHVIRIGRAVEILHMARSAIGWRSHKLSIDVALGTSNAHVPTGQRELRECVVIEGRRIPGARAVAGLAGRREPGLGMGRIIGLVEIRHVAAVASRRRVVELPTRMACGAIQGRMCASQRESGELQVIELRAHPVVHRVALFALDRQAQGDVVDANGLCADKVFLVARIAGRRQALELSDCSALVALVAIERGVRANQREAVQVLVDLLD